jgi:hypothetical protein
MADSQEEQTQQLGGLTVPPLPAHETTATSGTETETPSLAPEQTAALGAVADTTAAVGQAQQAAAVPLTQQAQAEADTAQKQADLQDNVSKAKAAEDARQMAEIAKTTDAYKQANDAIKAQPPVSLGADRNTWGKLTLALGMALAGFGDALSAKATVLGGHDVRTHSVTDIINSDLERQREMVAKLKDNQLIALTGVKDAQQARELALARIDMKGAEMAKQLQLRGEALTKAAGVNTPALQAKLDALKLDEHAAEFRSQAVAPLTQKLSRKSGVSNTDRDQKPAADAAGTVARDPVTGAPIGTSPTPRGAAEFGEKNANNQAAIDALRELKAHIEKYGQRLPNPFSQEAKDRDQLIADANVNLVGVSKAGQNEKAAELENKRLGPSGTGLSAVTGSYTPEQIQKLMDAQSRVTHYRNNAILGAHAPETVNKGDLPQTVAGTAAERASRGATHPSAGQIAINPQTGARIQRQADGSWKPL